MKADRRSADLTIRSGCGRPKRAPMQEVRAKVARESRRAGRGGTGLEAKWVDDTHPSVCGCNSAYRRRQIHIPRGRVEAVRRGATRRLFSAHGGEERRRHDNQDFWHRHLPRKTVLAELSDERCERARVRGYLLSGPGCARLSEGCRTIRESQLKCSRSAITHELDPRIAHARGRVIGPEHEDDGVPVPRLERRQPSFPPRAARFIRCKDACHAKAKLNDHIAGPKHLLQLDRIRNDGRPAIGCKTLRRRVAYAGHVALLSGVDHGGSGGDFLQGPARVAGASAAALQQR
eukprot:1044424-Prymnesium_polylepis.1